ncbi:hypothetical protein HOY80DRAFT_965657 [Tuber brumale]|nr:hypothetical protein HOY80DRAFT_965657 [Tuber brumale]
MSPPRFLGFLVIIPVLLDFYFHVRLLYHTRGDVSAQDRVYLLVNYPCTVLCGNISPGTCNQISGLLLHGTFYPYKKLEYRYCIPRPNPYLWSKPLYSGAAYYS